MRMFSVFATVCLLALATGCDDVDPNNPSASDPDTSAEQGLATEVTITLSAEGTPDPSDVTIAVDGTVTFDNTGSSQEAEIDFSSDLPSAPDDLTVAAGSTGTVVPEGSGEWSYTNRSAGAGVPASGTITSEYAD